METNGQELLGGRYRVGALLGSGGMAEVRDGWDLRLDRAVAIKLMHPALKAQADVRGRFEHEARAAASLTHPNIVAVHDFGDHDGTPYIVMERLPGRTLADLIAAGPLPPHQVHALLDEVLAALATAHDAGMLHRDIKPGNILLATDGRSVKVADFGIAKTAGAALTATGQIVGTMAYLSPERVGGAPASVADDLYAVGVMGYEALLGRAAFPQDTPIALARAIMDDPPPPLSVLRPDLHPVLAGVIDRAMTREPTQRFASADQMRAALAGDRTALFAGLAPAAPPPRPATMVLDHPLPPTGYHPAAAPPPARPTPRRRLTGRTRTIAAAAAVVTALAVAALALAMDPFSTNPTPQPISTSTTVPPPKPSPTTPTVAPVIQAPEPAPAPEPKKPGKKGEGKKPGNGKRE
ncbi:serine/threonine-protein kinase [Mycolicibacterium arseniciresistens]|uniref:non-specific serine/threonine protein kinase n=1 Tax=Mycolicibacterium arseniciresistens TaxID=3062257 RepID=A0ABT8UMK5_9MYCO|nr:serine/threonine-protein kinase [Mycolicibacterium arseniciresistens]MDO3639001.1 serine/threonine-protein kinase [Mycolicibacterium arseniciresistens]